MGSFSDRVLGDIRKDFYEKGKESFLYQYMCENMVNENSDYEGISKKAKDFMYNLGYPISAVEKYERAKEKYNQLKKLHTEKSDYGYNKKSFDKRNDKLNKLKEELDNAEKQLSSGGYGRKTEKSGKHKNTALDMVDRWESSNEIDDFSCEVLYELIKRDDQYSEVIIPLKVDKETGTGLYAIGNDRWPNSDFKRFPGCYCQLGIYSASTLSDEFEYRFWDGGYPDIKVALEFYNSARIELLDNAFDNTVTFPKGAPKVFEKYFYSQLVDNVDRCTDEEFLATKNKITKEQNKFYSRF